MGWEERDYASQQSAFGGARRAYSMPGRPRSVVTILIVINVAIYVLCSLSSGPRGAVYTSPIFTWCAMLTQDVLHGQIWRLMTSDYLHWSTTHLLMNMLGLHFLGRSLEQLWGSQKFFAVYTIAGILGSLFYMGLEMSGWLGAGVAAGASGCVLGLLGAAAVLFPHAEVYIYFLFPVKIRIVAFVLGGAYVLNLFNTGANAGGDACHLAGLGFGVWWAMRGDQWWSGRRRKARVQRSAAGGFAHKVQQRQNDAETIDRILSKVHERGIASLSERDKRSLADATLRQKNEEHSFDRTGSL